MTKRTTSRSSSKVGKSPDRSGGKKGVGAKTSGSQRSSKKGSSVVGLSTGGFGTQKPASRSAAPLREAPQGRGSMVERLGFEGLVQAEPEVEIIGMAPPVHPGEILREEFMEPLGLTPYAVAKAIGISRSRLERIVREDLGISGDTAVRLGRYFGTSDQFWMNLQAGYEVERARRELGDQINAIVPIEHEPA